MNKINTIAHLADIHIRRLYRHKEYREVFNRLYKQLEVIKPDVIYIGGDVVHGKLDTSPEEVRLVSDLFLNLSNITTTIVIPGNHDVNLNNKSREDALSPIIDLVKEINPNLHYWKKSGKYTINNVDFGVLSIFDIDDDCNQLIYNLPKAKDLDNEYKIALFHGGVGQHKYDNGFIVQDEFVSNNTFLGYDLTLLGDIHLRQFLNKEKTIGYCGSTIQQGFSEELEHGFLLWDLNKKSAKFHKIDNDYGYKLIDVENNKIISNIDYIPIKGNIKIRHWNTSLEALKDIQLDLRKKYPKLKGIKVEKQDTHSKINSDGLKKINIGDVRNTEYQNKLISEFLKQNIDDIEDDTINRIHKINEMVNNSHEISDGDIARNVDWKINSFEFNNMFSYGEKNKIDFKNINGIVGIVAPNHSGKSSIISSIAYTLFDTCDRTNKAIEVLNKKKDTFDSKLNLEVNGEKYWIERIGTLNSRKNRKTGEVAYSCPVKVKYYMEDGDETIDLAGAARKTTQYGSGTNEGIRSLLGTFDDFILTSLSLQSNGSDFVDKKQSERKQILSQFMDIGIFEDLYNIAKKDSNEERILLKNLQKRNRYSELATIDKDISDDKIKEAALLKEKQTLDKKIKVAFDDKLLLTKELQDIDKTISSININAIKDNLAINNKDKLELKDKLNGFLVKKEELRSRYIKHNKELSNLDKELILNTFKMYEEYNNDLSNIETDIKILLDKIKDKESTLYELSKYEYDSECDYCLKNGGEHINHKSSVLGEIDSSNKNLDVFYKSKNSVENKINSFGNIINEKSSLDTLLSAIDKMQIEIVETKGSIDHTNSELSRLGVEISTIEDKIKQYNKMSNIIDNNLKLETKIDNISKELSTLQESRDTIGLNYNDIVSRLSVLDNKKCEIEKDIDKTLKIEQLVEDYDLYLLCMSKDGIQYELISRTISIIENEINNVLDNMLVGFTLKLEMDGKNINTFICYDNDCWNLELSSGMERFVSNLAIRVGLINVSTLPRPNFIAIDEGFGALDNDNLSNMKGAFDYLKTQFDFILIISHLETIKDYMDKLIPIEVNNGFSSINFT